MYSVNRNLNVDFLQGDINVLIRPMIAIQKTKMNYQLLTSDIIYTSSSISSKEKYCLLAILPVSVIDVHHTSLELCIFGLCPYYSN